jgi:hypothetical protein
VSWRLASEQARNRLSAEHSPPQPYFYVVFPPQFEPVALGRAREPFSHPDWIFEVKWDGFRALLYSDSAGVRLVSRNRNTFQSFPTLCEGLARDLKGRRCILDGEIVCLDAEGKPQFADLLFRWSSLAFRSFVEIVLSIRMIFLKISVIATPQLAAAYYLLNGLPWASECLRSQKYLKHSTRFSFLRGIEVYALEFP